LKIFNIFESNKIRYIILALFTVLQIISVSPLLDVRFENLFVVTYALYFAIGFLSTNWLQALKNLLLFTVPVVLIIVIFLFILSAMQGKWTDFMNTIDTAFTMWELVLLISTPLFILGFAIRVLILMGLRHDPNRV
jgi:hypothetical protein